MAEINSFTEPLALATLIADRCRDLGLSQADLVRRTGYRNIPKGLWRLHDLFAGGLIKTKAILDALPAVLDLPNEVVHRAIQVTQQQLDDRKRRQLEAEEAAWRAAFKPHAIILTERTVPSPIFIAAIIGVERLLRVDFDVNVSPVSFVKLALDGVKQKLAEWGSTIPAFGRPTGIVVNYSPDFGVRFDLDGTARETFDAAYRIGQVYLLIKGRPVPAGVLPRVAGPMV
jgi:hypothetical protein